MKESKTTRPYGPLEEIGSEWFVNRQYELNMYWKWADRIPRSSNSYALVGLRRTGKTAILTRLFNQLFHEQDRVIPVYISFARYLNREKPINSYEFAEEFFGGYIRSYLAFRYRLPELINHEIDLAYFEKVAKQVSDTMVPEMIERYNGILHGDLGSVYQLVHWVIGVPRARATIQEMPTAVIVDEFQVLTNVYNPDSGMFNDVTNGFQQASESRYAPMLVSGSAISLLIDEALGGMLSGRFTARHLPPLDKAHTVDMVYHLAKKIDIRVNEEFAIAVWELTQGYPFAIESLMLSSSQACTQYPSVHALEKVLFFELTDTGGRLLQHYSREFRKYTHQLNDGPTTRQVMLWAAKYPPNKRFKAEEVAADLGLEPLLVQESLEKLRWIDVVYKIGMITYYGPSDPMMRRYIEYEHLTEVSKIDPPEVEATLRKKFRESIGRANRIIGQFAEIVVDGVMSYFDDRQVDGERYFDQAGTVTLPRFATRHHRFGILQSNVFQEIDLIGETYSPQKPGSVTWLVQVKYTKDAVGEAEVHQFFEQIKMVQAEKQYAQVACWYVSKGGFTKRAVALLREQGVLMSDHERFNRLANLFGLLGLPL